MSPVALGCIMPPTREKSLKANVGIMSSYTLDMLQDGLSVLGLLASHARIILHVQLYALQCLALMFSLELVSIERLSMGKHTSRGRKWSFNMKINGDEVGGSGALGCSSLPCRAQDPSTFRDHNLSCECQSHYSKICMRNCCKALWRH